MTINKGKYCKVDLSGEDVVTQGPKVLPQNDLPSYNINNSELWSDAQLKTINWLPYVLIDNGTPGEQYNRSLSDFDIQTDVVEQTAIYTEWTQVQKDQAATLTLTESQRIASDLAAQTDTIKQANESRKAVGSDPIIPAEDEADVDLYLAACYAAVDDPGIEPTDPPGAIRQLTVVLNEHVDRMILVHGDYVVNTLPYWGITARLYTIDAIGMSLKIHNAAGTYLWTQPFVETEPDSGVWEAPPQNASNMWSGAAYADRQIIIFQGKDISQKYLFKATQEQGIFDVRWTEDGVV